MQAPQLHQLPSPSAGPSGFPNPHQSGHHPGPRPEHGAGTGAEAHDAATCPGCQAELEAALKASQASAQEEDERRRRQREEDEAHLKAVQESEEEENSRREAEEEEILRQVMEASRRDEEAAQVKRLEQERYEEEQRRLMLEESRLEAIRKEQAERQQEEQLMEASRREAEASQQRREQEERRAREEEEAVLAESRRQMEEEWRRRDEEERAMEAFAKYRGELNESAYWRSQIDDDAFKQLSLDMERQASVKHSDQAVLASESGHSRHASSSRHRALPPTPGLAAQAAGIEPVRRPSESRSASTTREAGRHPAAFAHLPFVAEGEASRTLAHEPVSWRGERESQAAADAGDIEDGSYDDDLDDDDDDDPFADSAEAPPTYEEAGVDRPPEAPDTIPNHVRFDAPPRESGMQSTISDPSLRFCPEKSAPPVSSSASMAPNGRSLPAPPTALARSGSGASGSGSGSDPNASRQQGTVAPTISQQPLPQSVAPPLLAARANSTRSTTTAEQARASMDGRTTSIQGEDVSARPAGSPLEGRRVVNPLLDAIPQDRSGGAPSLTPSLESQDLRASASTSMDTPERASSLSRKVEEEHTTTTISTAHSNDTISESRPSMSSENRVSISSESRPSMDRPSVSPSAGSSSAPTTVHELQQTAMKGTDFGYCAEPFAPDLLASPGEQLSETDSKRAKERFPNVIQLTRTPSDGSGLLKGNCTSAYFVIRAPSWKSLLRAMAWYGNTRIEAGPEEVADRQTLRLNVEVEFVTPSKTDYSSTVVVGGAGRAAHVAICISLMDPKPAPTLTGVIKGQSRGLDSSYLRRGSARRVIHVPRQSPALPMGMVKLAQHLHAAHTFSAACPSSSSTALHSPRDLHHAVERHDVGYVAKVRKAAAKNRTTAAVASGVPAPGSNEQSAEDSNTGRSSRLLASNMGFGPRGSRESTYNHSTAAGTGGDEDVDPEDIDADGVEFFAGVGEEEAERSGFGRMKDRMKRRLGKRAGDGNVVDEDLESWISESRLCSAHIPIFENTDIVFAS